MATSLTSTTHEKRTSPVAHHPSGLGTTAALQVVTTGVELPDSTKGITAEGTTCVPVIPLAAQQALSGAGAVNITSYYTAWTTTGADAGTLANGAALHQLKKVQMIVDGGDGTLTPASFTSGSTITFADVGDFAVLLWDGTGWVAIELGNDADGATAPVVA